MRDDHTMECGIVLLVIMVISIGLGITSYFFWGADNPVEQVCEKVIEEETGVKIDLSPELPSKDILTDLEKK